MTKESELPRAVHWGDGSPGRLCILCGEGGAADMVQVVDEKTNRVGYSQCQSGASDSTSRIGNSCSCRVIGASCVNGKVGEVHVLVLILRSESRL